MTDATPTNADRAAALREQLATLRAELREIAPSRNAEPRLCEDGCGLLTKGGRFLPGHDAKLKGRLLKAAVTGDPAAKAELTRLGWLGFLAVTQASHDRKAEARRLRDAAKAHRATQAEAAKAADAPKAAATKAA